MIVVGRAGGEDWTLIVAPAINAGVIGSGDAIASKHAITQDRLAASYANVAPERHSANRSLSTIEPVCGPPIWKLENDAQRPAPETRPARIEKPKIAGQRLRRTSLRLAGGTGDP